MLFGVAMAVVAGFLMTAVQTWTGVKGTSGGRLAFIVMLWIAARVLFWTDTPLSIIALVDTAFLVLTGWEVGYRVVITKRWRNLFFYSDVAGGNKCEFGELCHCKGHATIFR